MMPRFVTRVAQHWVQHNVTTAAAAVTFYTLFALAPTFVYATATAAWLLGRETAGQTTQQALTDLIGKEPARMLLEALRDADFAHHGLITTVVSTLMLLYGASAAFVELRSQLNITFGYSAGSIREQVKLTLIGRLLAAAFALATGGLLVLVMLVSAVVSYLTQHFQHIGDWSLSAIRLANHGVSLLLVGLVFSAVLRFLPMRSPPWRHVLPAVLVTVILFEAGKYLIAIYLGHSLITSAYGPSGAVVAVMVWTYYSSQIFLLGAELVRARIDGERDYRRRTEPTVDDF